LKDATENGGGMVRKKVLLVDDSTTIRKLERLFLGERDFEIVEVSNGEDALSAAVRDRPDIILLDVNMPTIDGIETYRRLRRLDDFAGLPILFITGMTEYPAGEDEPPHSVRFPDDEHTGVLRKPLHVATLREKVQALLLAAEAGVAPATPDE
jgi:DNA-binding response OmpR family regulator